MNTQPLKLVSAAVLEDLAAKISSNADRYKSGDFAELASQTGWEIETKLAQWDPTISHTLDASGTPEAEVKNSLAVYKSFKGVTPALAREERLWVRLCHVEFLEYARNRWLSDEQNLTRDVGLHFFANGLRGCRDQNAIGRLWWNGHLAALASPEDIELGLNRLLAKANIRLQIMDRAEAAFRTPLIKGIFRLLGSEEWFNSYDAAIADFMFEVNKRSGGVIFEAFDEDKIDDHLLSCLAFAKLRKSA